LPQQTFSTSHELQASGENLMLNISSRRIPTRTSTFTSRRPT
jgi:hypothetical protein